MDKEQKRMTCARWAETAVVVLLAVYTFCCGLIGLHTYGNPWIGGGVCAVAVLYVLAVGAVKPPLALCLPLAALISAYVLVAQIVSSGMYYLGDTVGLLFMLAETTVRSYTVLVQKRYFYTSFLVGEHGRAPSAKPLLPWLYVAEVFVMVALAVYAVGCGVLGSYLYRDMSIGNGVTLAALLYLLALAVPLRYVRLLLLPASALVSAYVLIAQILYQFQTGQCILFDTLGLLCMLAETSTRSYAMLIKKRYFYTSFLVSR